MRSRKPAQIDALALAGVFMLAMMLLNAILQPGSRVEPAAAQSNLPAPEPQAPNWDRVAPPYDSYVVTQGLHGYSYGHAAIDLTAGEGEAIKSPIHGIVQAVYLDEWNNTAILIENERYQVTLLHGLYSAVEGQEVDIGEVIGTESNQGYTVDYLGRLCAGRDCGYHTHLNIFDKEQQTNVNPLDLFDQ
jgi:hypothetical protein